MRSLIWFRSDLRTADNTALHHAAKSSAGDTSDAGVIGVFIVSPGEWRVHDYSPAKVDLILRTLTCLSSSLAALNIPLLVLTVPNPSDIPGELLKLMRRHHCSALWFNREYELNESRRDTAVTRHLTDAGLRAHACTDQSLIGPGEVQTTNHRPYTVYTHFRSACFKHLDLHPPQVWPVPARQDAIRIQPDPVPTTMTGWKCSIPASRWPGGERAAAARLDAFTTTLARDYHTRRDLPALGGTSELSPHLAVGSLSPRQCLAAARGAMKRVRGAKREGFACWINELLWREFFIHVMHSFPRVCKHRAFQAWTERVDWLNDETHFTAWKTGTTGVPIVDAGMRQLKAEGWMHNRVRMIAAMFLAKNLLVDWRWGERWFMQHLVDGFLASNNGGWQWAASTGTDAAPYFRIFNPVVQSERFDPQGEYIRRYVPELRGVTHRAVHDPSRLAPGDREKLAYPPFVVDLRQSRLRAINAFQSAAKKRPDRT